MKHSIKFLFEAIALVDRGIVHSSNFGLSHLSLGCGPEPNKENSENGSGIFSWNSPISLFIFPGKLWKLLPQLEEEREKEEEKLTMGVPPHMPAAVVAGENSAPKVDHRLLGAEMDLFSFHEEAPGFPFFKENFLIIRDELLNFWREEHRKLGYQEIETPAIFRNDLWVTSGHWKYYKDNMYWLEIDGKINVIKPMNCPGGVLVYKEKQHSYRELPLKIGEIGKVYRRELSGVIQGLFRTRDFLIDDAHIYMRSDQMSAMVNEVIELLEHIYRTLGFSYLIALSTRPEKSIGSDENWEKATAALKKVLDDRQLPYTVKEGDGAFYGPKIDFDIEDSLGRKWQCGTIQLDLNLPERFDLTFQNAHGEKERVIMLHRAILGGVERFIAILLEHFAGKLPLWLAPVQVLMINVREKNNSYLKEVQAKLLQHGLRVKLDLRDETIDKRIREAVIKKINYCIIIGDKEERNDTISVRRRDSKKMNNIPLGDFLDQLSFEIEHKVLPEY